MTDYVADLTSTRKWHREDAENMSHSLRTETTILDGVIRWNSNGKVVPADCAKLAEYIGLPVDLAACDEARDAEFSAFVANYKKAQARRTPEQIAEERFEARAVHGPGVRLVNIFTGQTIVT